MWMDKIKINLGEVGLVGMNWIVLVQDRDQWNVLVKMIINVRVP
jgi:hypothetical protein